MATARYLDRGTRDVPSITQVCRWRSAARAQLHPRGVMFRIAPFRLAGLGVFVSICALATGCRATDRAVKRRIRRRIMSADPSRKLW